MTLETEHLYKSFGAKQVLADVSFRAEGGKALGLLGRNGAGKTTTLRILMQVFPADAGHVTLDGQPLIRERLKVGYMPEERGLYPKKKILEQLVYLGCLHGLKKGEAAASARSLLKRLEMSGVEEVKLETLSKGNQQKIQLAATLIADPDLVILDEPFSGLDPVNAGLLKDIVKELMARGKMVIFSSHQMNYIEEFCEEICILSGGRVAVSGNLTEIKRSYPRNVIALSGRDNAALLAEVKALPFVREILPAHEGFWVRLEREEDKEALLHAVGGLDVDEFRVCEPSLNDIFVQYTTAGAEGGRA